MSCLVLCCECKRFLGRDGKAHDAPTGMIFSETSERKTSVGYDYRKTAAAVDIQREIRETAQYAEFEGAATADAFAVANGWTVEDADGPNHRCAECIERAKAPQVPLVSSRGAHVWI